MGTIETMFAIDSGPAATDKLLSQSIPSPEVECARSVPIAKENDLLLRLQGNLDEDGEGYGNYATQTGAINPEFLLGLCIEEMAVFTSFFLKKMSIAEIAGQMGLPAADIIILKRSSKRKVLRAFREINSRRDAAAGTPGPIGSAKGTDLSPENCTRLN